MVQVMERDKQRKIKIILFLIFISGGYLIARTSGVVGSVDAEKLLGWFEKYETLAPALYVLAYAIAPSLFVPGIAFALAAGVLFGPFWGILYAITGATLGACVAFLIARYLAREWVASRLTNPRWQSLDQGIEKHGWKLVAIARLIPLFPYNLLNYAFGLTGIRFIPYALATFLGMLPGCIAYIVLSSSLPDLVRGKISTLFLIGLLLVAIVSIIPLLSRTSLRDQNGLHSREKESPRSKPIRES